MFKSIKTEIYKGFNNSYFVISLLVGFAIQMLSFKEFYDFVELCKNNLPQEIEKMPKMYGTRSVFINWIGHEGNSIGFYLAEYMLPLLAALPFGWSFFSELQNGYQNNMLCRLGKIKYFTSKYLAVFLTGAFSVAFMLLSNFIMCSFIGVWEKPQTYTLTTVVFRGHFASKLFYTHPFLFVLVWTSISALWGGALAGLTMLFAQLLRRSIFVMIMPFLIPLLLDTFLSMVIGNTKWSFIKNYFVDTSVPNPPIIFFEIFALIIFGYVGGLIIYKRKEAL